MKQLLLSLLIATCLIGCGKDAKPCWECTVNKPGGGTYKERGCGDYPTFLDANGNVPFHTCKEL